MSQITPVVFTPEQRAKWEDTCAMFNWAAPGFRHIFYSLLENNTTGNKCVPTLDVPVAATDGKNIMINPETFFDMSMPERTFVLAHEVVHNIYNDPALLLRLVKAGELHYPDGVVLPFDNNTFQAAMDYRINAALVRSKIGKPPSGKYEGCYDEKIATADDGVYDVYRKVYDPNNSGGGGGKNKPGAGGPGGFDTVLKPGASTGQDPDTAAGQRDPQAWAQQMAVAQQLESMKSQGRVSADLQRMFDMYIKPQVPWADHIRGFFARKMGSGGYTWRRPNRRLIVQDIYAPGRSGFGCNWVTVWGDTSGSIGVKELNTYFAELGGLIEDLKPRRVTVYWCDAKIKQVDDIYDITELEGVRARGVKGGGGTSCKPVFKRIAKEYEKPDAFVGLTDGLAEFPDQDPGYPCVWAVTTNAPIPFGGVVRIKPDGG